MKHGEQIGERIGQIDFAPDGQYDVGADLFGK